MLIARCIGNGDRRREQKTAGLAIVGWQRVTVWHRRCKALQVRVLVLMARRRVHAAFRRWGVVCTRAQAARYSLF